MCDWYLYKLKYVLTFTTRLEWFIKQLRKKKVEMQVMLFICSERAEEYPVCSYSRETLTLCFFLMEKWHVQSLQAHVQGLSHLWITLNFQVPSLGFSQPDNVTDALGRLS